MLRIAICDDVPQELQGLVSLTSQYLMDNSLDAEGVKFSHPDALLNAIEAKNYKRQDFFGRVKLSL